MCRKQQRDILSTSPPWVWEDLKVFQGRSTKCKCVRKVVGLLIYNFYDGNDYWFTTFTVVMIIDLQFLRWQWLLIYIFYNGYDNWFTNFTIAMIIDSQLLWWLWLLIYNFYDGNGFRFTTYNNGYAHKRWKENYGVRGSVGERESCGPVKL